MDVLSNPVAIFLAGAFIGWMASKVLTAYLWAKKRDKCLKWLNKNSKNFGFAMEQAQDNKDS
eukprot:CAMPEP_0119003382 /NCGR_PEP_ID=MMETSP1176-20130426/530_1 /TAXON_ID=265551 /ORGANISM="Synedropsis recta cf, Strain CCMP1620" /LENGTH=61 /DNA_ID=CAMNT_0006954981 /DNA_START=85 /DNA_END=270 /DNA_ORIENTATION=+